MASGGVTTVFRETFGSQSQWPESIPSAHTVDLMACQGDRGGYVLTDRVVPDGFFVVLYETPVAAFEALLGGLQEVRVEARFWHDRVDFMP